ncbi:hypothetical protein EI94DRAFT_1816001 [Lactarius quietus]|nr:hypothetical protein EI94DRAFT_1816001 [Lactarius quietus]
MSFASLPSIPSLYETAELCPTDTEATKSISSEDFITAKASTKAESLSDFITAPVCKKYHDVERRCKPEKVATISEITQVTLSEPIQQAIRAIHEPVVEPVPIAITPGDVASSDCVSFLKSPSHPCLEQRRRLLLGRSPRQTPSVAVPSHQLTFIAAIQNALLLLRATLALIAATHQTPLTPADGVLAFTVVALLAWEFTADNQQFAYHAWKHSATVPYDARAQWPGARLAWTADDAACGFCTRGLWAWNRHPNFPAEKSVWGVLNLIPLIPIVYSCSTLMTQLGIGVGWSRRR